MQAKMKCSNCGAEMSNLNMSWGKKQLLLMIPVMLIGFWPLARMTYFKGDITKEVTVSDIQKRPGAHALEIVGLATNEGRHDWSGVTVQAEFYDAQGGFLSEATEHLQSDIKAGAKEHFKISIHSPSTDMLDPATKVTVKVSSGYSFPL